MIRKYICLYNPHDERFKIFHYRENKELYAPNYGTCICDGDTIDDALANALLMFNISEKEVLIEC